MQPIQGLHHITAVASDAQTNVDFYHHVLGQRLVKTTVNFDDPGTYHLYYGDETGTPGTVLTFFPWRQMPRGVAGNGEAAVVAYAAPSTSLAWWRSRLAAFDLEVEEASRMGAQALTFRDPDGMRLELIADDRPVRFAYWAEGPIPEACALRGFHSVALWLAETETTARLLTEQMGYTRSGEEENRTRYVSAAPAMGVAVDLIHRPGLPNGSFGAGSIHHIAFRVPDDAEQLDYRGKLLRAGQAVTPVQDRQYFHSIYFRTQGGVLFEVATDTPGFATDETVANLGSSLKLPAWLEPQRSAIERRLPPLARRPVSQADATLSGGEDE
jgi:glyoxalase family protein